MTYNLFSDTTFIGNTVQTASVIAHSVLVTAAGNYTVSSTDRYVVVNKTAAVANTVVLPASPTQGRLVTVSDGKGDAAINPITITASQNIDQIAGTTGIVLSQNWASMDLMYTGTFWKVL